jgi:hypothetical protein
MKFEKAVSPLDQNIAAARAATRMTQCHNRAHALHHCRHKKKDRQSGGRIKPKIMPLLAIPSGNLANRRALHGPTGNSAPQFS